MYKSLSVSIDMNYKEKQMKSAIGPVYKSLSVSIDMNYKEKQMKSAIGLCINLLVYQLI